MSELVVVALGGNALDRQAREARVAAERLARVASTHRLVVTHGNGPQVGRILIQQEAAAKTVSPMPLDVCGAESQGQIGYLLQVTIGVSTIEYGRGDGTTRRHPPCGSSFITQPRCSSSLRACAAV